MSLTFPFHFVVFSVASALSSNDLLSSDDFRAVGKLLKSPMKATKSPGEEATAPPPVPVKHQPSVSTLQARPSVPTAMSKSVSTPTNELSSHIMNTEASHQPLQGKPSMSNSIYGGLSSSNKDENNYPLETNSSPAAAAPPVAARPGKAAMGTRVLPALDPNGEPPPVRLRPLPPAERKRNLSSFLHSISIHYLRLFS